MYCVVESIIMIDDVCDPLSQGIDSPEPMLQLDNYVFKGRYVDTLGTAMIFKKDKGITNLTVLHCMS